MIKIQFRGITYTKGKQINKKESLRSGFFFNHYEEEYEDYWYFIHIQPDLMNFPLKWEEHYLSLLDNHGNINVFEDSVEIEGYFGINEKLFTTTYFEAIRLKNILKKL